MNNILNFRLFKESRLSDVAIINSSGFTFNNVEDYSDNFIKYKTISKRFDNKKLRLNITWNDTIKHNLKERIKNRTSLKTILELNTLLSKGLDEIYVDNIDEFIYDGNYSLWFSEYDFSLIIMKKDLYINIITILPGLSSNNVKNVIELKSTL